MTDTDRKHLVGNIAAHLQDAEERIQLRQCAVFLKADTDYGTRVAEALGLDLARVRHLATMSDAERASATAR